MTLRATAFAFAAFIAASGHAWAANTINFSGEVTDQTCSAVVDGNTDPTVVLQSVPVSALNGTVGKTAGETSFTLRLTGCVCPDQHQRALHRRLPGHQPHQRRQPDQHRQWRRQRCGAAAL